MSFFLKGFRSSRGRQKFSYFQPLSIVEVVYQERPNRDLHTIKESKLSHLLHTVQTEPIKLSLGLAIMEIFYDTVKQPGQDVKQYDFLHQLILNLDQAERRLIHFFIFFLVHHSRFLGFFPSDQSQASSSCSFEPSSGIITPARDGSDRIAFLLRQFLYTNGSLLPDDHSPQQILFSSEEKRELIKTLFTYYQYHIDGFQYPQTMKVFAEVFG